MKTIKDIQNIDAALDNVIIADLVVIAENAKKNLVTFENFYDMDDSFLNEDTIIVKYNRAFKELKKITMDTPSNACISCERLCFKRDAIICKITESNKFDSQQIWSRLMEYNKSSNK